jgi:AbrB family looped-hinge helix DNA binding protein
MAGKSERVRIGAQGRLVIPARFREQLGLRAGDEVILRVKDGQLVAETPAQMLARIQQAYAHLPGSMADELVAERKAEARRELEETEADQRRRRKPA